MRKMRRLKVVLMLCFALVFASTVRAQVTGGTNNAELNGDYAFTFNGFSGSSGGASSIFAAVGRFTADGAGNLTNGKVDTNGIGATLFAQTFTGTYAIGADHRGVLNIQGVAKFAFAMMANGNAQFIEFDASGGSGTTGSGTIEKADTTAYDGAQITGDYAFGVVGMDHLNHRAAMAGRFTSNGTGSLTNAAGDVNAYGAIYPMSFTTASYTVPDTATGRATMNLSFTFGGGSASLNFVFYILNAGKLFAMERDTVTSSTPLLNGIVLRQQSPAAFSNASLNGRMVIYLTGLSHCGSATATVPKAVAGLLTADGNGAFTLTYDENFCRAANSVTASGTYSVASNGRISIDFGTSEVLAAYPVASNQAFLIGTDDNVLFGFGESQQARSFTNSDVKDAFAGSTTTPATFDVVVFSGEFMANGGSPSGNITGTADVGSPSGPMSGAAFNATYSVSSSPTNGRGTMTVTSGSGGSDIVYVISTSKFVAVPLSDQNPGMLIFERSLPPQTAVPPSITSQPSSQTVTAGQTATFTVTASGTAPLSYQWQKNGSPVGTNSASYTTPVTTADDNGAQFTVVVSNSAGSATSNAATLTVNVPRFTLTVTNQSGLLGLGSGSVTSNPAGIDCGSACSASYVGGTTVILTAHPNLLSGVGWWAGCDGVSADGTACTVNMNAARSVVVNFKLLSDPSLGSLTGSGTVTHNGNKADFSFNAKYSNTGTLHADVLYVEHQSAGDVVVQSVATQSVSITGNSAAIVTNGFVNNTGNYTLMITVTDNGEPGTNVDLFGLEVWGPSNAVVPGFTFPQTLITSGNIKVHR